LQEETENGNPQEDGKKMFEQEEYSGTDSDDDEVQYGARRRKPEKGTFRGNKYLLKKSILLYHCNKKLFFKGCMEIKIREEEKFLYSLLLQIMKMVEAEVEIMFVPEDVGHEHLLLKIMKMGPITLPGRQTFEAKLMTK
jgi:hypothetical protein